MACTPGQYWLYHSGPQTTQPYVFVCAVGEGGGRGASIMKVKTAVLACRMGAWS